LIFETSSAKHGKSSLHRDFAKAGVRSNGLCPRSSRLKKSAGRFQHQQKDNPAIY
jgi:hypothetical protein